MEHITGKVCGQVCLSQTSNLHTVEFTEFNLILRIVQISQSIILRNIFSYVDELNYKENYTKNQTIGQGGRSVSKY